MRKYLAHQTASEQGTAAMPRIVRKSLRLTGIVTAAVALLGFSAPQATATTSGTRTTPHEISTACAQVQNSEVEEATAAPHYLYAEWIGCGGIGFARSANGGATWTRAVTLPGSSGFSWDPAIAVGPDGTVYAAYMHQSGTKNKSYMYPQVAISHDHGASFSFVSKDTPPKYGNWGDRDFIAAGRDGKLYLTWDYGPSAAEVKLLCSGGGSCAYAKGDLNAVIQISANGGKTWGPIISMAPGFPANGGYGAPLVAQPDGTIDAVDWTHHIDPGTLTIHPGHEMFLSSKNGITWPSHPKLLYPGNGSIALPTWWIDGDLSSDQGGDLYITWDTQTKTGDIGWLTWSVDHGAHWAAPVRVTPDTDHAVHIVQVAGAEPGIAYIGWQTDAPAKGYATYVRPFSVSRGWLGPAVQVSTQYGNRKIWPGDTFGFATLPGNRGVALSWGSAVNGSKFDEIYAAEVSFR
jgi:hypothetical protein